MSRQGRHPAVVWVFAVFTVIVVGAAVFVLHGSDGTDSNAGTTPGYTYSAPAAVPTSVTVSQPSGRPLRVVFIGDSLTVGFYASKESATFRSLVTAWLDQRTERPVTASLADRTSGGLITLGKIELDKLPTAIDLAVVEIGVNDVGRTSPVTFTAEYARLMQRLQSAGARAVCLGIWSSASSATTVGPYASVARSACISHGGVYEGVSQLFDRASLRGPAGTTSAFGTTDDFHPNDQGQAALAGLIEGAVRIA